MFFWKTAFWIALLSALHLSAHADETKTVSVPLTEVVSRHMNATAAIAGELMPFQKIDVYARLTGFLERVDVDRGSRVSKGQVLATITAPEMDAEISEAGARVVAIRAESAEAEAKLAAAESTFGRLKEAARTPGAVAGNDLVLAEKGVEAARARVQSLGKSAEAAEAAVHTLETMKQYMRIVADFDGVITERFAHPGSLVGPESRNSTPMFRLEQIDRLRLVAAVPEIYTAGIVKGMKVAFVVPALPTQTLHGTVARSAQSLDAKSRTMPVELDVPNPGGRLAPGMYAEVAWPLRRSGSSLFVPASAIKSTTERVFVIRVTDGKAEWVDVRRGIMDADLVEVFGGLNAGDRIVVRATDEIRPGTRIVP